MRRGCYWAFIARNADMKRSSITVALLIMIGGTYFRVWGNSNVAASSMPDGSVTNVSAGKSAEALAETGARAGRLPDSPSLLSQATPASPRRQHWVALSWDRGVASTVTDEDVVGYNVYRRTRRGNMYIRINGDLVPGTNYVDDSVRGGEVYYYQTTAVNGSGIESGPSNRIRIRIPYP
jgi:hypothetical protein